jgi:hypothetical protein
MDINTTKITIADTILDRAKQNDRQALELMFQQFIGGNEKIQFMEYMGQRGFFLFIDHNFACLTEKRIMSLKVGSFGEVLYQDAFLEDLNSSAIYQPSIFGLYVVVILTILFLIWFGISFAAAVGFLGALVPLVVGFFLIPFIIKTYYRMNKCGVVFIIKQGLSVFVFVNRSKLTRANVLWRVCAHLRETRVGNVRSTT